jgi:hypothetical protein
MFATKFIDHTAYPKSLKNKCDATLRDIIKQCHDAMEGWNGEHPNGSYYSDEINYCDAELFARSEKVVKSWGTGKSSKTMVEAARIMRIDYENLMGHINDFDDEDTDTKNDQLKFLAELKAAYELIERNRGQWG